MGFDRSSRRLSAELLARSTDGLDLVDALLLFIHAHGDELDHRLGDAQTALKLGHQLAVGVDGQQNVVAFAELAHEVGQLAASQLLGGADRAAAVGHRGFKTGDQLVHIFVLRIRTNDKHYFVKTLHSFLSALASWLPFATVTVTDLPQGLKPPSFPWGLLRGLSPRRP